MKKHVTRAGWAAAIAGLIGTGLVPAGAVGVASGPRVLRVGAWHGIHGAYETIQAAVDAARPGDWVLVGPGDYRVPATSHDGVSIRTPGVHLRGMDRNDVIVDGTTSGAPCTATPEAQATMDGGRNGLEVVKASGVSIENLTACNFLSDTAGEGGNEILWNGGYGTGVIGLGAWTGRYLTGTSSYYKDSSSPMAQVGIFASSVAGPGLFQDVYGSNMGDAGVYIGGCPQCSALVDHVEGAHSAYGYSTANVSGRLVIQNSEFDDNGTGMILASLNSDDPPAPQDGACPNGQLSPETGTTSCTVLGDNHVHDNNGANVPRFGQEKESPTGTGIAIFGGANDTVRRNAIDHNGAWGVAVFDYPDTGAPAHGSHCQGGIPVGPGGAAACYFVNRGNRVLENTLDHNGFFGNPGNGDLANTTSSVVPGNCFLGNTDPSGLTTDPPGIQTVDVNCGTGPNPVAGDGLAVLGVGCDGVIPGMGVSTACGNIAGATAYPPTTGVTMPVPPRQPSMPDPCVDVPANPWCPRAEG